MKKIVLFILMFILCFGLLSCSDLPKDPVDPIDPNPKQEEPVVVSTFKNPTTRSSYDINIISNSLKTDFKFSLSFNPSDFINNDHTKYDKDLLLFSLFGCLDSHDYCVVKTNEMTNTDEANNKDWWKFLGFDKVEEYHVESTDGVDTNDTTNMLIASGILDKDNILVNISLQGTDSSTINEWISNFDMGASTTDYTNLTGTHNDWSNKDNHKGFDTATTRCLKLVKEFIEKNYPNNKMKVTFCVNGYSRGAACANLLAAKLIDKELKVEYEYEAFAYTFATPQSTCYTNAKDVKYNAIINIINSDDVVPILPPSSIGFVRYGQDISVSIKDNNDLKQAYKDLTGKDYTLNYDFNSFINTLVGDCKSREEIYYVSDKRKDGTVVSASSEVACNSLRTTRINLLTEYDLTDDCYISDVYYNEATEKYEYYYYYSLNLIVDLFPTIIMNKSNTQALFKMIGLFDSPKYLPLITELMKLSNGTVDISMGHYPQSYFVIINNLNQ